MKLAEKTLELTLCHQLGATLFPWPAWPALAALVGAAVYVAVTAVAIAAQQAIVEWGKAGADANINAAIQTPPT